MLTVVKNVSSARLTTLDERFPLLMNCQKSRNSKVMQRRNSTKKFRRAHLWHLCIDNTHILNRRHTKQPSILRFFYGILRIRKEAEIFFKFCQYFCWYVIRVIRLFVMSRSNQRITSLDWQPNSATTFLHVLLILDTLHVS